MPNRQRILIVDDDSEMRDALTDLAAVLNCESLELLSQGAGIWVLSARTAKLAQHRVAQVR
jgi:hypothetical protein